MPSLPVSVYERDACPRLPAGCPLASRSPAFLTPLQPHPRLAMSDLQEEGRHAIDSPMSPASVDVHPEDTLLGKAGPASPLSGHLRPLFPPYLCPPSCRGPASDPLVSTTTLLTTALNGFPAAVLEVLIDWVNDVLVEERIIVKQLEEDLYDGQVLQKLLEKLAGCKLNVAEVTQSEVGQRQKLQTVLEAVHGLLRPHGWALQWTVDAIHGKNLVAILHLLVALAMHFRAPIRLPEHVSVQVVVVRKREGLLHSSHITEELTTTTEELPLPVRLREPLAPSFCAFTRGLLNYKHPVGWSCVVLSVHPPAASSPGLQTCRELPEYQCVSSPSPVHAERDAFDTLFDHAPDKLSVVKKSLITFVNKHLNKLNLEVTELETQFADGVYLVLLMGLLEDYFVPLHNFYLTPDSFDQKVHNVAFAFELMLDGGLKTPKARPEDVVNLDLKSTLRVLYNLFTKYKNLE
uniref:beta-parvin n=1 Tax=Panthera onca TaxID=9690 RepID=UPI0029554073|nr:beta-parvin [Panthera onca]